MKTTVILVLMILASSAPSLAVNDNDIAQSGVFRSVAEPPQNMRASDGALTKKSFFRSLFGGGLFAFTDLSSQASIDGIILDSSHGWWEIDDSKLVGSGKTLSLGAKCEVGQYIRVWEGKQLSEFASDFEQDRVLFSELWYKSNSGDLVRLADYYTANAGRMWVGYECFERVYSTDEEQNLLTYTCVNDEWRGEPGTQYSGNGGSCAFGCKADSTTINTKDTSTVTSILCKEDPTSFEDPKPLPPDEVSLSEEPLDLELVGVDSVDNVEVGQKFSVVGTIEIGRGICEECVVETTTSTDLGATKQALSVTTPTLESETGVCGDDRSTGVKFKAVAPALAKFELWVTAKEVGKWSIPVYASSGCGGKTIDVDYVTVAVVESHTTQETIIEDEPEEEPTEQQEIVDLTQEAEVTTSMLSPGVQQAGSSVQTKNKIEPTTDDGSSVGVFVFVGVLAVLVGIGVWVSRKYG